MPSDLAKEIAREIQGVSVTQAESIIDSALDAARSEVKAQDVEIARSAEVDPTSDAMFRAGWGNCRPLIVERIIKSDPNWETHRARVELAAYQRGAEAMKRKCIEAVRGHADWALSAEQAQAVATALESVEVKDE